MVVFVGRALECSDQVVDVCLFGGGGGVELGVVEDRLIGTSFQSYSGNIRGRLCEEEERDVVEETEVLALVGGVVGGIGGGGFGCVNEV